MFHMNELPLRRVFTELDGKTSGYKSLGIIGKQLVSCESLPVVRFKTICTTNTPEVEFKDLSSDQQYLYKMCAAVMNGECCKKLALLKPGPLNHSRWLTMACRSLRLYVATQNPLP